MTIEITNDEAELIAKLLTLLDRGMESDTLSNLFGVAPNAEWEQRMLEAAQSLAEQFPD